MSDTVIKVENLGKRYLLSHSAENREKLFSALLANKAKNLFRCGRNLLSNASISHPAFSPGSQEEFWALKDVSFEIKRGERVGIIGRNGAGKSTLLKIISRITEPTTGRITINGRVASLLEVGTGFHSELSGRENIFLNGAVLGMGREEIKRKFDEIVAFAEVEKFLDTPVKRYSSGMHVRLAFAVAAHLEPEILIVDEVLAVGDAQFQKKCLGKMEAVGKEGRTVFFVSHNTDAVTRLCTRGLLLRSGLLVSDGLPADVIREYLGVSQKMDGQICWGTLEAAPGDSVTRLRSVRFLNEDDEVIGSLDRAAPLKVALEIENIRPGVKLVPRIQFINDNGVVLFTTAFNAEAVSKPFPSGVVKLTCTITANFFAEGNITLGVFVTSYEPVVMVHVSEYDLLTLCVVSADDSGTGIHYGWPGVVRPHFAWECPTV
jgi:lipopolysaccharide transport system ATP-binding protein